MATLSVNGSINNVGNGRYVVQVRLLSFDGAPLAEVSSQVVDVTGNPAPVIGPITVSVS